MDKIDGQPLYQHPQNNPMKASEANSYYQQIYERELFYEKELKSLQTELEITKDNCGTYDLRPTYQKPSPNETKGSSGKGFVVLFMKNIAQTTKNVYVTSARDVQLNITTSSRLDSSLKIQIDRNMRVNLSHHIIFPTALELTSFKKEVKSVLIETSEDVNVISFDDGDRTVGSTANIPIHKLSTKYIVISIKPSKKSQLAVAAIENNTTVSITFKMKNNFALEIEGEVFYNGGVFSFSLDRFETYQIEHSADLTGSVIESSFPIAAFSGNDCTQLHGFGFCDHLITQLPPTDKVDKTYIIPPNSNDRKTIIRITTIEKSDIIYIIGSENKTITLDKLEFFETQISSNQICFIESSNPVIVTGIGLASKTLNLSDPSMTIIPGINQYLNYFKVVVPSGFVNNFVTIMIKEYSKDLIRINSTVINLSNIVFEGYVLAGNIIYSVRSIRVVEGVLTAFTLDGEKFGMLFSGIQTAEAYSFSGNFLLP